MLDPEKILKLLTPKASRDQQDLEEMRDITDDVIESDFVPYACLFDPYTIATKNGELLQIIRLSSGDAQSQQVQNLREIFRQAIAQKIPNTEYALWLHTMRRSKPLMDANDYPENFTRAVDREWRKSHGIDESYSNAIYVTLVRAGEPVGKEADRSKAFLRSLWPPNDVRVRSAYMQRAAQELNATMDSIMEELQHYGARRLGIAERDGVPYGEHLEFLEQLINLEARPMPIVEQDLSEYLTSGDVTFGFNAMEVRTAEGKRRFAAIMTIKEYKEASLAGLDQFLEIPCELIVTQCFDFIGAERARKEYQTQARYVQLSNDKELESWAEIDQLTNDQGLGARGFGQQQLSLFMIAPSLKQLENNIKMVRRALTRLGLMTIREDLRFEEMYWAQLPANFTFIARSSSVNTAHLGGFVKIEKPPLGNRNHGPWGPPLTIFRNAQGAPKFFSFHDQALPHTAIIGRHGKGRTTLLHSLLAHTRKWPGTRLWMIDSRGRSKPFIDTLSGTNVAIGKDHVGINPFLQQDSEATREFIALWVSSLLDPTGAQNNQTMLGFFQFLAAEIMQIPPNMRNLEWFVTEFTREDPMLAKEFAAVVASLGDTVNAARDSVSLSDVCCFDISAVIAHPVMRGAVSSYLLHRITMALDGTPTIIVLDEAFLLLDNPLFGSRLQGWMDYVTRQNVVLITVAAEIEASLNTGLVPALMQGMGHRFVFPDEHAIPEYMSHFGLTEESYSILAEISGPKRFVIHQEQAQLSLYRNDLQLSPAIADVLRGVRKEQVKKQASDVLAELMGTPASEALA